ncbi:MAG: hypothetical protein JNJ73_07755 [Hyphomonadaceae bacterium]|nr:hypothetical protein [Hyphomonadaceae bacterium]
MPPSEPSEVIEFEIEFVLATNPSEVSSDEDAARVGKQLEDAFFFELATLLGDGPRLGVRRGFYKHGSTEGVIVATVMTSASTYLAALSLVGSPTLVRRVFTEQVHRIFGRRVRILRFVHRRSQTVAHGQIVGGAEQVTEVRDWRVFAAATVLAILFGIGSWFLNSEQDKEWARLHEELRSIRAEIVIAKQQQATRPTPPVPPTTTQPALVPSKARVEQPRINVWRGTTPSNSPSTP